MLGHAIGDEQAKDIRVGACVETRLARAELAVSQLPESRFDSALDHDRTGSMTREFHWGEGDRGTGLRCRIDGTLDVVHQ